MAIEERFTAIITARNEAARVLGQIGRQFAALGQQTGLTRIGAAAGQVGRAFAGLATQIGAVVAPLAAIGATAAAVGLVSMTTQTAAAAGALSDLSARTGVSVRDLEELSDVARLAGVGQDTLASAMQKLNRSLADAATGGGGDLAPALRHLGISMRDANGEIRSAADLLPELADAFARNENQALRVRLATELFGRAGEQLIPMLANGSAAIEEQRNRFRQYGFSLSESAERLAAIDDVFETLQVATQGLTRAIGAELAPVLGPIAQALADWVRANRELIATRIGEWVTQAAEAFSRFFADRGPLDRLEDFARAVGGAVEWVGGIQNVLIAFGALAAAPFVAALVGIVGAFVPLLSAIGSLAVALGAASPVGIAVLAFAGLAAVVMANWGALTGFFTGLWDGIVGIFQGAMARLQPIIDAVTRFAERLSPSGTGAPLAQRPTGGAAGNGAQRIDENNLSDRAFPAPAALPQPAQAAAAAAPRAQEGRVQVDVNIAGAPPGTRVETQAQGGLIQRARQNVGYSMQRAPGQ